MDDFSKLQATLHMLEWLADDPFATIKAEVQSMLAQQVAGAQLIAFQVTSDPQWLTGVRTGDDDPDQGILVRTGVAFEFALNVEEPTGAAHHLVGVLSWVGVHLDDPEQVEHRLWIDLEGTLDEFGSEAQLKQRMYFA